VLAACESRSRIGVCGTHSKTNEWSREEERMRGETQSARPPVLSAQLRRTAEPRSAWDASDGAVQCNAVRCGAESVPVCGVFCAGVVHKRRNAHPATNHDAVQCEAADARTMVGGTDEIRWMNGGMGVRRVNSRLD
jgi:hypothetical protein